MSYSKQGLSLTESFEGCKLTAYEDPLRNGLLTIGYGHVGSDVHSGMTITQEQAEELLASDIHWANNVVNNMVPHSSDTRRGRCANRSGLQHRGR